MAVAVAVERAEWVELEGRAEVAAATVDVVGSAVTVEAEMMVVMVVVMVMVAATEAEWPAEGMTEGMVGKCIRAISVVHKTLPCL